MAMRPSKVPGKKAGPNGSFPVGDKKHARLAIGGATRSFNAGNIGKGTEAKIKAEARAKLGEGHQATHGKGKGPKKPKRRKAPAAHPEFAAGQSTSRARSWAPFAQGPQVQQAPGLGAPEADDEAPEAAPAGE